MSLFNWEEERIFPAEVIELFPRPLCPECGWHPDTSNDYPESTTDSRYPGEWCPRCGFILPPPAA